MNIKSILLASSAIMALSAPALSAEVETYKSKTVLEKNADGSYSGKETIKQTDKNGTDIKVERKINVDVDANGNAEKNATTKTVIDPKGLGNKHVVKTNDSQKIKEDLITTEYNKTVEGKNQEGIKDNYKSQTQIKSDAEGNYVEKDKTTKTEADGTKVKYEKNAIVDVDSSGNVEKVTKTKKIMDPKGLNNSKTVTTTNQQTIKNGVVDTNQEIKVDGKTVESNSSTTAK